MIKDIFKYKFFIINSIKTEFKTRYARSKVGLFWAILHPLAQVLIYAVILSSVLSNKLPGINNKYSYAIYLMSGMLCWSLFNEIFARSVNVFVDNANIIKKMPFPKIVLILNVIISSLVNNFLLFISIVFVFSFLGHFLGFTLLILPFFVLLTIILASSFGLIFGILNVFLRDIWQFISIALQFLFWLTPIVYMIKIIPQKIEIILYLNPLLHIVNGYHDILVYNKLPNILPLLYPLGLSVFGIFLAYNLYIRANKDMADIL
ncbi:putative ABC-2 type transport system permease protein [Campylobacter sputorum subsp. bubulus]|uniref:Transport permease protein n=1 Tax=Campylobacter sputorum subsp. sputorum TaxID=32024 RepID=A0A381DJD6_9BACT|nr:ABC transporter permease [Campylobacter sputorum]ASM35807.1 polysaccharide ABC transporter, permease protein [Campylobacter sputorum aubsp. sputorum RM3237]KAB0581515.1 ABC transporter permease [Campylobacter sputorum subsp. sputorum]QEL05997.1 polysaccharide/polyol phosphate ABC transporter, permease protein [Campylobacter sputorum subsp. sputorum]SUX09098.1 putative ABC-2 type transport system permease protein [Campylobacter sputorum subsp. bubulus]SUX10789.1 putative ABC-2 type transport